MSFNESDKEMNALSSRNLALIIFIIFIPNESKCDNTRRDRNIYIIETNPQGNIFTSRIYHIGLLRNIPFYLFHFSIPYGLAIPAVFGSLIGCYYGRQYSLPISVSMSLGANIFIRECSFTFICGGMALAVLITPLNCLIATLRWGLPVGSRLFYYLCFTDADEMHF